MMYGFTYFAYMEQTEILQKFGKLTQIDISIMQGVANEVDKDDIAKSIGLTKKQVYSKLEAIKKKINVTTTAGAVAILLRNNFIK